MRSSGATRTVLAILLASVTAAPTVCAQKQGRAWWAGRQSAGTRDPIEATVTMIEGDTTPATTPGPGDITSGVVAFDYNHRSLFVALAERQTVSTIVLKCDPASHRPGTSNENLLPGKLQLFCSDDNVVFRKLDVACDAPDKDTVVLSGFSVGTRYLKLHAMCDKRTAYRFVNYLSRMLPSFRRPQMEASPYYELPDPLFEELLGDAPGPKRVLYWAGNCDDELSRLRPSLRANAKRFGHRYVFEEQLRETAAHRLVYSGKRMPWLQAHGIDTWRFIIGDPGKPFVPCIDGMPLIFGPQGWLMDPRWQRQYFKQAVERARAGEQWALSAGDETWEVFAINAVPKAKRYREVIEADKEIREHYGFGKYGMPDGNEDAGPFGRIAHRRWVSDRLTDLFRRTYEAVKEADPDTVMMAPDFASGVPAADIEAWAPYFDLFQAQCSCSPSTFVSRFCVGCDTKVLKDLCGKATWMSVQNATPPDHGYTVTPEFVREMYSQVFRNGGDGLFLLASEWFERELNHPKFAEPAKWRALLHVVDTVRTMTLPRLPAPDCAILYSSDSLLTLRWAQLNNGDWELYSAYAALGPLLRSWFHVVSDRQIERGVRDLSDYKVLYIPFAEYERASVLDTVEAYVRDGGTVVCTDSEAFTWDLNGDRLTERWERLTGVTRKSERKGTPAIKTVAPNPLPLGEALSLTALVPGWKLSPVSDRLEIVAAYADGSPAVTLHPHGRGRVIYFAADPFIIPRELSPKRSLVEPGAPVVALLKAVQQSVGARMGHDVWRFKLPPFSGDMYEKEGGVCLTNNYVYDRNEPLLQENNLDTGGTYTYSRVPTGLPDCRAADEPISFSQGHLTNRAEAYGSRRLGYHHPKPKEASQGVQHWLVSWPDRGPIAVTFDLTAGCPLDRVRLFYSGTMPALSVLASKRGDSWYPLASHAEEAADGDVKDVALGVKGTWRFVRLDFAARTSGSAFELCEAEIWGAQ